MTASIQFAECLPSVYSPHAQEVFRLRSDPDYAHLRAGDDLRSGELAAFNMRQALALAFPALACDVRVTCYGRVVVSWEDGPTEARLDSLLGAHRAGRYDLASEEFVENQTPFNLAFGGAECVAIRRVLSDGLINRAIAAALERFTLDDFGLPAPTVDDYRSGSLIGRAVRMPSGGLQPLQYLVREIAEGYSL